MGLDKMYNDRYPLLQYHIFTALKILCIKKKMKGKTSSVLCHPSLSPPPPPATTALFTVSTVSPFPEGYLVATLQ